MPPNSSAIRPVDVPVLLCLAEHPSATHAQIAEVLGISTSTAHGAAARLVHVGLAHRGARMRPEIARGPMLDFLQSALPYLFPPRFVPRARGIPTGLAAPVLAEFLLAPAYHDVAIVDPPMLVWPSHLAPASAGVGIDPLFPGAPLVAHVDPALYRWLALVDVLRSSDVRGRAFAQRLLPHLVATLP